VRVLFAIKSLNVAGGGAERVFVDVVNGLYHRGLEVQVLTFDYPGAPFYSLSSEIPRIDMACNPAGQPMPRLKVLRALPRMRSVIAAAAPDLVIAFMHSTYVPISLSIIGLGIPLVVSEHTEARHYAKRPLQRWLRQFVDGAAILKTVPTEAVRAGYRARTSTHLVVIPNPVKVEHYKYSSDEVPAQVLELLAVGRLMEEKDHMLLLRAFSRVADEFPDWTLKILGDGPLRSQLEELVVQLGLGARVEMPGYTKDVGLAYTSAKFVVVPSRYESFGMVAAEALLSRRAVLYFDDCAGVAEIVKSGVSGLGVHGGTDTEARISALASGLVRLMGDPDLCDRLGSTGPLATERYGLEAVLDRWEDIISQAKCRAVSKT
jgi:glycosyltransferase involved in cell wall biosynthesis